MENGGGGLALAAVGHRRGIERSDGPGRRVVERTLTLLNRCRRLTVRYERRADIYEAFPKLGRALICWNHLP